MHYSAACIPELVHEVPSESKGPALTTKSILYAMYLHASMENSNPTPVCPTVHLGSEVVYIQDYWCWHCGGFELKLLLLPMASQFCRCQLQ